MSGEDFHVRFLIMKNDPVLKVENLSVTIEKEEILKDLSFTVDEGDVTAIIGPNGAGKTVLFRTLFPLLYKFKTYLPDQ